MTYQWLFPEINRKRKVLFWNNWSEEERLIQLAGHLRGRASQEWNLLSVDEKSSFTAAVNALHARLDPGRQALAAQDFRHMLQRDVESVASYISSIIS